MTLPQGMSEAVMSCPRRSIPAAALADPATITRAVATLKTTQAKVLGLGTLMVRWVSLTLPSRCTPSLASSLHGVYDDATLVPEERCFCVAPYLPIFHIPGAGSRWSSRLEERP